MERRDGPTLAVERPEVEVMFITPVADEPAEIRRAWQQLEDRLGSLRGRRFFGMFDGDKYRACVQVRTDDDPVPAGFRTTVLPGGAYLRARLRDEPEQLYERIPDAFAAMESLANRDEMRPGIEHYRRLDEVDLLLPITLA